MSLPVVRAFLIAAIGALALLAVVLSPIPDWARLLFGTVVLFLVAREWSTRPKQHRVDRFDGRVVGLMTPSGQRIQGALQAQFFSVFYCAFIVHDPVAGRCRFGLFRDEVDPDGWRRLQVILRASGFESAR